MAGIYRARHPERTLLYRVLFHYFDRFLSEYVSRFEREYGFLRPVIQTFGDRINFHPHLHFLVTDGGVDASGAFHKVSSLNDDRIAEIFAREVLGYLVRNELLSPEWAERILSWRHTGFLSPQPSAGQDQERDRAGRQVYDPSGSGTGEAIVPGARGQSRLSLWPGPRRAGDDGLFGVHLRSGRSRVFRAISWAF
ncbi:MAG: transposase, partial [Candidatus Aminicenantales bacterium]